MSAPIAQSSVIGWRSTGNERDCEHLDVEEVLEIHDVLVTHSAETDDPISPPGLKSRALLESALGRPHVAFGGQRKYRSAEDSAAALIHSIVLNHPFHNGNKRTALVAALVFLDRNNFVVESTDDDLFDLVTATAAHRLVEHRAEDGSLADLEVMRIAQRLGNRSRQKRRDERAITAQKLARRLRALGCEVNIEGAQWVVIREVTMPRALDDSAVRVRLEHRVRMPRAGVEVSKNVVKVLRSQLHLDADHMIDSDRFYSALGVASDFVVEYSSLLRRLAAT